MRLHRFNLLPYLLGRSWIDAEAVLAGDAVVVERQLRHTSFVVEHGEGGVFVKQIHASHSELVASLRREVAVYEAVAAGGFPQLTRHVPRFVGFDQHECVLALERFAGLSAQDLAVAGDRLTPAQAAEVGVAVAATHAVSAIAARSTLPNLLDESVPWAFGLAALLTSSRTPLPGVGQELLPILAAHPGLIEWIGGMASWWRRQTLIHGDLKWENVLVAAKDATPGARLIDWELAAIGDPAWDVATQLQATLVRTCLERSRALEPGDIEDRYAASRAFAASWFRAAGRRPAEEGRRILGYSAVRLVYSAYEHATVSSQIHPAIQAMVTTAWRMLRDQTFAARLLGLYP